MSSELSLDDILPVADFCRRFPHCGTEASLRWQIFNASLNGMDRAGVVVRRGRRVFIVVPRYLEWVAVTDDRAA